MMSGGVLFGCGRVGSSNLEEEWPENIIEAEEELESYTIEAYFDVGIMAGEEGHPIRQQESGISASIIGDLDEMYVSAEG